MNLPYHTIPYHTVLYCTASASNRPCTKSKSKKEPNACMHDAMSTQTPRHRTADSCTNGEHTMQL